MAVNKKQIIKVLKSSPSTIDDLVEQFKSNTEEIIKVIDELKTETNLLSVKGSYHISTSIAKESLIDVITGDKHVIELYSGDTHYNAKNCDEKAISRVFNKAYDLGARTIYLAGDITDGFKVYQGHELNLKNLTFEDQLELVQNELPYRKDLRYEVINGNHDWSWMTRGAGNFAKELSKRRDDVHYLGDEQGLVMRDNVKILLAHGAGGGAYSRMYKMQVFLREYLQEESHIEHMPQIFDLGHFHEQGYMKYYGIHCILPGSFQEESEYTRRKGLCGPMGACLVNYDIVGKKAKNLETKFLN
jgi:predicted phosphodiesterase